MQHFPNTLRDQIEDAALDAQLQFAPRQLLFAGIDPAAWGTIAGMGAPNFQMAADIEWLNTTDQIADGSVPFVRWLENAARQTRSQRPAESERFLRFHDELARKTAGEPVIAAPEQLPETQEAIVLEDDIMPFSFLYGGYKAGQSVAHLAVPELRNGRVANLESGLPRIHQGTGWLFAPDLIMTNQHVIKAREGQEQPSDSDLKLQAAKTRIRFSFDSEDQSGEIVSVKDLLAWSTPLDYAVLQLEKPVERSSLIRIDGLLRKPDNYCAVNIIQHPDGGPKQIAIRNNLVTSTSDSEIRYFTDTRRGSSGSPVFDDQWRVIALHRGSTMVTGVRFQGKSVAYVNVGTQIAAIHDDLRANYPELWLTIAPNPS